MTSLYIEYPIYVGEQVVAYQLSMNFEAVNYQKIVKDL